MSDYNISGAKYDGGEGGDPILGIPSGVTFLHRDTTNRFPPNSLKNDTFGQSELVFFSENFFHLGI